MCQLWALHVVIKRFFTSIKSISSSHQLWRNANGRTPKLQIQTPTNVLLLTSCSCTAFTRRVYIIAETKMKTKVEPTLQGLRLLQEKRS